MKEYSLTDISLLMEKCGVDDPMQDYIRECVSFHTFPAAGLLIAAFMVDLALEKMGARPGEKLYAVSETPKCAPDALQVIVHATLGNHRLRIVETGRFAITINRYSEGVRAEGIRVFIDGGKVKQYPTLWLWYTNDPAFKGSVSGEKLLEEILCAGRGILAWEKVRVRFSAKKKWASRICPSCGEMAPAEGFENGVCRGCGRMAYYDKAPTEVP
ncbi:MAG: FmdE, Molybdenum formylmethanofuran dehydrogenase operon [Methanocella sp. PtaU1.Bin125]|nr:MAG: FmdE, Molybdenum formylmethanofuran dehydrogenase operon [Methanocella sp. PtaU1.Bin125]